MDALATARPPTYYRPPEQSRTILVRTERPGRIARYHLGAKIGDGPLMVPEACNLDQAVRLVDLGESLGIPAADWPAGSACRRCFRS